MRSRSPSPVDHIRQLAALRPCSHAVCHTPVPRGWISLGGSHFGATLLTTRLAFALAASLGLAMPSYSIAAPTSTQAATQANPFFADSTLPLHYPPFDKIIDSDFAPAFDVGMAEQLKEVEKIANQNAKPSFDNTIVALEKSGSTLDRATTVFFKSGRCRHQRRTQEAAGRLLGQVCSAPRCDFAQRQAVRAHPDLVRPTHQAGPGCARRAPGREVRQRLRARRRQALRRDKTTLKAMNAEPANLAPPSARTYWQK